MVLQFDLLLLSSQTTQTKMLFLYFFSFLFLYILVCIEVSILCNNGRQEKKIAKSVPESN